jgi:hypothetical protein
VDVVTGVMMNVVTSVMTSVSHEAAELDALRGGEDEHACC